MKTRKDPASSARLSLRIQGLTAEIEKLVPEVRAEGGQRHLLASAALSLERAAVAVKRLVGAARPAESGRHLAAVLTSPLLSFLGSRVVVARSGTDAPATPSAGAQALAILLEDPKRVVGAAEIAHRLGCSVSIARTTLNRLVKSGHAVRPSAGRFRARRR